jgi:hypothetical protein
LATERKTPLSEAASEPPGRAKKNSQRSKIVRRRAIVGGGLAVVVVGVLILLAVLGDKGPLTGIINGSSTPPPPPMKFKVTKIEPVATTKTKARSLLKVVKPAADDVEKAMNDLYYGTFIDPNTWDGDDYEKVFDDVMDDPAVEQAKNQIDGLTLGTDAGDTYESVDPGYSRLTIKVLTDPNNSPVEAIAVTSFQGLAKHDDGTYSKVMSSGSYFFRHEDDGWKIFAFKVARNEKKAKAPASASGSASAGATSS